METRQIGNKGEAIAIEYLISKGFSILTRNWQYLHRELDIVAQQGDTIVFFEVRARQIGSLVDPIQSITRKKQRLLVEADNLYIQKMNITGEVRFDLICITYGNNKTNIEHIENAFYPSVKKYK